MLAMSPPSRDIVLSTGSVALVPLDAGHLDDMWAAMTESAGALRGTMAWWRDDQTKNDIAAWTSYAESAWQQGTLYAFSVVDAAGGRYLGACSLENVDATRASTNLSYWVRSSATGRGIASGAARRLARWAVDDLGLARVEITMVATNAASIATARKSGAVFEGRLRNRARWSGESHDMMVFSFVPRDFTSSAG
ncbi:GNAT family N-acetyltransferase [Virgisporangium aurantiacum]|nr:GNAT family protein [Virgisporangium aurantiacum]